MSRLPVPASVRWICFPTSVEPVNATFATPGWATTARADVARAGQHVEHARGQPGLGGDLGEHQRGERRGLGGLEHDVLPVASAGAIFHAAMSSGKFHGITAPTTPSGFGVGPSPAYSSLSAQPAW